MANKITITKDSRPNRNKPWLVRWYGEFDPKTGKKKRYSKSFELKKEAEAFAEGKHLDFKAGMPSDLKNITLNELCNKFIKIIENELGAATIRGYQETITRLKNFFNPHIFVTTIQQEHAEEFISQVDFLHPVHKAKKKCVSDSTRSKQLRQARTIFLKAKDWDYIKENPFREISLGKIRKRPWHYIEVNEFNAVIDKTKNLRDKALYGVMYWLGFRYGEAVNLLWDGHCIDFDNNKINIFNRPATKNIPPFNIKDYEERSISMNKWVYNILTKLQAEADDNCPFVFLTKKRYEKVKEKWHSMRKCGKGNKWENRYILNCTLRDFKARCKAAGINTSCKINLHCLRKSWAMNLANSGKVPAHTLKELGGWSNIKTCDEFYLQTNDANKQRALEVMNELSENKQAVKAKSM